MNGGNRHYIVMTLIRVLFVANNNEVLPHFFKELSELGSYLKNLCPMLNQIKFSSDLLITFALLQEIHPSHKSA